jgi:hypothetical protein
MESKIRMIAVESRARSLKGVAHGLRKTAVMTQSASTTEIARTRTQMANATSVTGRRARSVNARASNRPVHQGDLAAFRQGSKEAKRRQDLLQDLQEGLLGQFEEQASPLVSHITFELFDYLLDRCGSDTKALTLLAQHSPKDGYRSVTPVGDDVALALRLLNEILSVARCDLPRIKDLLANARDRRRQAGTRKERRPQITEWIQKELARDPSAKSPDLWSAAPDWITDQIAERSFAARVTACRKTRASK